MNVKLFKAMLRSIKPEDLKEAHKVTVFIQEQMDSVEETKKLSDTANTLVLAALLIEYGRLLACEEENGPADPERTEESEKQKPCQCANTDRAAALKTNHGIRA